MVRNNFCQVRVLGCLAWLVIVVLALDCWCVEQEAQRIPRQRPRGAALLGTIHDQFGNAVFGARVSATNLANNQPSTAFSDGEGIFRLTDLPAGQYQVVVEAEGIESTPQSLTLEAGQMRAVTIRIEVARSPERTLNTPSGLPGIPRTPGVKFPPRASIPACATLNPAK